MIISMFDKSLLERRVGYAAIGDKEQVEPCMQIRNRVAGVSFVIPLDSMWKYVDPLNAEEERAAIFGLFQIAEGLQLATDTSSLTKLQDYIQAGLTDLKNMKPYVKKKRVVGEFDAYIDSTKFSGALEE